MHDDYTSEALELQARGDLSGAAAAEQATQDQLANWLPRGTTAAQGPAKRMRKESKVRRVKSQRWIIDLDNAIRGARALGVGLLRYQFPHGWRSDEEFMSTRLEDVPLACIAADQGSDGWCGQNWMDGDWARINFYRCPDFGNHGSHNDWLDAPREVGLSSFLHVAVLFFNISFLLYIDGRGNMIMGMHALAEPLGF